MRIIHRVTVGDEPERRDALSSLGVRVGTPKSPLINFLWFDLDESDPEWSQICSLIAKWRIEDGGNPNILGFAHTEFSAAEFAAASFFWMLAAEKGYPQPENSFGYREMTHDLSEYCSACGVGKKQIAPFRMKGEPKWGRNHIFQLNWVPDQFFVLPSVWEEVFRPLGIERRPVLHHRTGAELQTVVQLEIADTAPSELALGCRYRSEVCGTCGREKFLPITRGYFPAFVSDPPFLICHTREYFGSGGSGWNATIVNRTLYDAIQAHRLVGASFVPLEASAPAMTSLRGS